jgi:hypothetical protein
MADAPTREHYLHERYLGRERRSRLLDLYYAAKPLIPHRIQLGMRRAYAPRQAGRTFPAWPVEPILVEREERELRKKIAANGGDPVGFVNWWPDRHRFAVVLTHDVEGTNGVENVERVVEVEERHGFVSSWNFVAEWYPIPDGLFDLLRARGCEIGIHGIKHDGKLFGSRARFDAELPKIHDYAERWGAVGFRSPATGRNADWIHELELLYDSSFPDTDPFEPQPGGCCSIRPFMFGDVVELPITLVQDHTLFEILREPGIESWTRKAGWIMDHLGLINLITHPDYLISPERLDAYERFLVWLRERQGGWQALPRDVARWWRSRDLLAGDAPFASTARARLDGDELVIET